MNLDTLENKIGFQLGFLKHSDNVRWLVAERRIKNKHNKHKRIINQRWQSSLKQFCYKPLL